MNLVKVFLAAFATSAVVSTIVAVVRAKRKVNKVAAELEEEFRTTSERMKKQAEEQLKQSVLNSEQVKTAVEKVAVSEAKMDKAFEALSEDDFLNQPAIKVGGKNKIDPLEFAKSIKPEDIKPI